MAVVSRLRFSFSGGRRGTVVIRARVCGVSSIVNDAGSLVNSIKGIEAIEIPKIVAPPGLPCFTLKKHVVRTLLALVRIEIINS